MVLGGYLKWKVVLEKDLDSNLFAVSVPALPGCFSQGKTRKDALKNIRGAIELHLECLAEDGIPIRPQQEVTTVAVNV
ncbi:MAG: HicB family protein [Candidatus Diapherotrites archaeon CG11_big_fil_rev_8_21_14_0_20_37_9]|nr:MAG: HicB family protein [Candidatus Diapherotrites archaeon CG11_big_fil_rev_8_21_14_0_20_37_9]